MAAKTKAKKIRVKKVRKPTASLKKSAKNEASQSKKKASSRKTRASSPAKRTSSRKNAKRTIAAGSRKESNRPAKTKTRTRRSAFARASSNAQALSADADSQGLSTVESADSESVGELLDEGNTFEAGVVEGVEQADDADEREVRSREIPEDDVPEEYLDRE